jgi:hypothetical protein
VSLHHPATNPPSQDEIVALKILRGISLGGFEPVELFILLHAFRGRFSGGPAGLDPGALAPLLGVKVHVVRGALDRLRRCNVLLPDETGVWSFNRNLTTWERYGGTPRFNDHALRYIETGEMREPK